MYTTRQELSLPGVPRSSRTRVWTSGSGTRTDPLPWSVKGPTVSTLTFTVSRLRRFLPKEPVGTCLRPV